MSNKAETMKKSERTLTPKLRFPEFGAGEGWQTPQLSDLYCFKRTNTLSRDKLNYEAGTIKNIHYGDIHTKFKPLFRVDHEYVPFINPEVSVDAFEEEDDCEEGDIVLADASEDLNDVGKAIEIISLDGQRVVAGTHTILATRHGSMPVVGFGAHLFQSAAVRAGLQRESQGAKVYGISANRISPVVLPLPPTKHEQQKIADCLSSLDVLIAAAGRKLAALRDHKRGLMQQLFPQPGQSQPRLRFPEFRDKGEWEECKLGKLVNISSGKSPSQYALSSDGIFPFVKVEDLNNCTKYQVNSREYCDDAGDVVPRQSILFPKRGAAIDLNKIRITAVEILIDTNLMAITPRDTKITEFLFYYLGHVGLSQIADKSTIPQINNKHIIPFNIFVPSRSEQHRVADCLTALDDQITAQAVKIDALKTHKCGLMQQLFPPLEEQV